MLTKIKDKLYSLSQKYGRKMGLDLTYFMKNGFYTVLRQGIEGVAGIFLAIVFARLASQEIYGQYQFILSIFATVSILSIPGLNVSLINSVAKGSDGDYKKVVKASFFWSLLGVPALLAIGAYYFFFGNHSLGIGLMVAAVFFPFFYAPNTWYSFLQAKERFDILLRYSSIQAILNALATIIIIFFSRNNLFPILVVYLASYTFFNGYYYYKSLRFIENDKKFGGTVAYGFFMTKISIVGTIANNIDKLLIGIFLSPGQLAIYSIGILFANQAQSISKNFLWLVILKAIKRKILSKKIYVKIFIGSLLITAALLAAFKFIIPLLFSQKYAGSVYISEISILFYSFYILSSLYKNEIIFEKKEKILFMESFLSPIIKILLSLILLPFFGIAGLAFLFGFYYVIVFFVLFVLKKYTKLGSSP